MERHVTLALLALCSRHLEDSYEERCARGPVPADPTVRTAATVAVRAPARSGQRREQRQGRAADDATTLLSMHTQ